MATTSSRPFTLNTECGISLCRFRLHEVIQTGSMGENKKMLELAINPTPSSRMVQLYNSYRVRSGSYRNCAKKADVPLFVVHDPRQWGGNTQASLQEALIAMRSTVKNRIIGNALEQQGSSAFTRGRMLGQIETETKWQLKDKKQRAKELLGIGGERRRKLEKEDWSVHDKDALENKLIERKVIHVEKGNSDDDTDTKLYTSEMAEIARECVMNQPEENSEQENSNPSVDLQQ
mmetsp:Transcript_26710/g.58789  ORF Transcript_26710/g.58789 Transcript_26710/m.58789 type:complete len:233 (-) Transcript_26710:190-888(-)